MASFKILVTGASGYMYVTRAPILNDDMLMTDDPSAVEAPS